MPPYIEYKKIVIDINGQGKFWIFFDQKIRILLNDSLVKNKVIRYTINMSKIGWNIEIVADCESLWNTQYGFDDFYDNCMSFLIHVGIL